MLERETLAGMDETTRQALRLAADDYEHGPARLKTAILEAARDGEKPADIARAISYVHTYDYVARMIREDKTVHPGLYKPADSLPHGHANAAPGRQERLSCG